MTRFSVGIPINSSIQNSVTFSVGTVGICVSILERQFGQVSCAKNQGRMHFLWKICLHSGITVIISFLLNSSTQTLHVSLFLLRKSFIWPVTCLEHFSVRIFRFYFLETNNLTASATDVWEIPDASLMNLIKSLKLCGTGNPC